MKTVRARTLNELVNKIYKAEGWDRKSYPDMYDTVLSKYGVAPDYETNYYVATKGGK